MELETAILKAKSPTGIIEPSQCNEAISLLGGLLTDLEEELWENQVAQTVKWAELKDQYKTNAEASRRLELTPEYAKTERTKRNLAEIKRLRGDLKDRFQVLSALKRY